MQDKYGRQIEYMRVSITDRCDLRCRYCMPEGCDKVSMKQILRYEEIIRICGAAAELGITRLKITGGEPFARLGCIDLIGKLKAIDGIEEVTVTTNGQIVSGYMDQLAEIGLDGINISLDSLDADRFRYITGGGELAKTLASIDAAVRCGIKTKINCLIQKGFNEDELMDIAGLAFEKGIDVRFIEMMPIGVGDASRGLSNDAALAQLKERWQDLQPDDRRRGNGPAVYYSRQGVDGSIGFISAIHGKFCSSCNRVRLTSQGVLKQCLCYDSGVDIRPALSGTDEELRKALRDAIYDKPKEHCFDKEYQAGEEITEHHLMSQIGG